MIFTGMFPLAQPPLTSSPTFLPTTTAILPPLASRDTLSDARRGRPNERRRPQRRSPTLATLSTSSSFCSSGGLRPWPVTDLDFRSSNVVLPPWNHDPFRLTPHNLVITVSSAKDREGATRSISRRRRRAVLCSGPAQVPAPGVLGFRSGPMRPRNPPVRRKTAWCASSLLGIRQH